MPNKPVIPLSESHPHLAAEWHPEKNGDLTLDQVVAGSHKKGCLKWPKGPDHEWEATIKHRTGSGRGCRFFRRASL